MCRHERRKSWGCHTQISILDNFTSDGNWSDGISLVRWNWDPKESWHACIPFPWGKVGWLHHRMQFLMKPCIQPKSSMGGAAKTCTASYCESISSHSFISLPTKITIIPVVIFIIVKGWRTIRAPTPIVRPSLHLSSLPGIVEAHTIFVEAHRPSFSLTRFFSFLWFYI